MSLLKVKELSKDFNQVAVLDRIDLDIKEGELINLIGRSGCGKTTFLNLISGLLKPTGGEIYFDGKDILTMNDYEISRYRNMEIGYIPQGLSLFPNLNIYDNIRLPLYIFNERQVKEEKIQRWIEFLEIKDLLFKYPNSLSGGQIRRVLICRALVMEPRLLIADEPTSSLDLESASKVIEIFKHLKSRGMSIIIATHDLDFLNHGDRIYEIKNSKMCQIEKIDA